MVRRNRARYLAPLALAATVAGTYLIVHASLTSKPSAAHAHAAGHRNRAHRKFASQQFYVVQSGDSLTSIAAKTGTPLTTLETLNPTVDPNSLQTGQRLRLRR